MKVAFASKEGIYVNEHFGWAQAFYIYEVQEDSFELLKVVDSSQKYDDEVDKLSYKIESLDSSDIVYVTQIGPKASNMVQKAGVYPLKAANDNEKIEEVIASLQKLMSGNAPLWLKRIMLKG
ncbi:MAG: dinitrogenase iron-molybdenum cofactor biosynthesis protein [Campylobacterales bacterium]|nr:dinitrogenase iron-molybdenum cofactor biosynthesis protein [Campylobacterales bacterium]